MALDYMMARYYSPRRGRFASPDIIMDTDPQDPGSWNSFGYVRNRPTRFFDSRGLAGEDSIFNRAIRWGAFGGPCWTGGEFNGTNYDADARDALDEAYKPHDGDYRDCGMGPVIEDCVLFSDVRLVDRLRGVNMEGIGIRGHIQKDLAETWFALKS